MKTTICFDSRSSEMKLQSSYLSGVDDIPPALLGNQITQQHIKLQSQTHADEKKKLKC